MNEVMQNGEGMQRIADEISNDATEFGNYVEEMYSLLERKIGATDDGERAWFGPKASEFIENINAKKGEFETAKGNIEAVATNLREHAQTWAQFENRG